MQCNDDVKTKYDTANTEPLLRTYGTPALHVAWPVFINWIESMFKRTHHLRWRKLAKIYLIYNIKMSVDLKF